MSGSSPADLSLILSPEELVLVRAALQLLLAAEDDPEEIQEIKRLLARLGE